MPFDFVLLDTWESYIHLLLYQLVMVEFHAIQPCKWLFTDLQKGSGRTSSCCCRRFTCSRWLTIYPVPWTQFWYHDKPVLLKLASFFVCRSSCFYYCWNTWSFPMLAYTKIERYLKHRSLWPEWFILDPWKHSHSHSTHTRDVIMRNEDPETYSILIWVLCGLKTGLWSIPPCPVSPKIPDHKKH